MLRGASLEVGRGEAVAILGRNGSGKTTLLRIAATLLRPTRGSGKVFGHDLVSDADAVRNRIGLLGHTNAVYPDLTATENLGFTLRMLGRTVDPRSVDAALTAAGLALAGEHSRPRVFGGNATPPRDRAAPHARRRAPAAR